MRRPCVWVVILIAGLIGYSGCAQSAHQVQLDPGRAGVPSQLQQAIDRSVTFAELKGSPSTFIGRVVEVGGIVLLAKRAKNRTEVEVLQLPLAMVSNFGEVRTSSEGRFLAVQKSFLDPATVEPGSRISVIGEVVGDVTKPLDEINYTYPVIEIKHLVLLGDSVTPNSQYGSYYDPGYYYGGYRGSRYWGAPYYWGAPFGNRGYYPYFPRRRFFPRVPRRSPSPSQPAPQNIPPQFKKKK